MSRSYRRNLIKQDHGPSTYYYKREASKTIRRIPVEEYIADGGAFRKYYNPYNISDYRFFYKSEPMYWSRFGEGIVEIEPDPIYKWRSK